MFHNLHKMYYRRTVGQQITIKSELSCFTPRHHNSQTLVLTQLAPGLWYYRSSAPHTSACSLPGHRQLLLTRTLQTQEWWPHCRFQTKISGHLFFQTLVLGSPFRLKTWWSPCRLLTSGWRSPFFTTLHIVGWCHPVDSCLQIMGPPVDTLISVDLVSAV